MLNQNAIALYTPWVTENSAITIAYYEDQTGRHSYAKTPSAWGERANHRDLCLGGSRYAIYLWSGVVANGLLSALHPEYKRHQTTS